MKNGKLVRITAMFFALMLCFTILSRAADQLSVAAVTTERPQNRMIEHAVRTSGKIVQNQELAVTTLPDQRVTAIYVREGQRVAKGDLLFEVDTTLLEEQILNQEQEMEKQELMVKDAKSQKEVSAAQKANSQAQAAEQYSLSTKQAGVQLSRAKQQLEQAKKKLKKFRKSAKSGKSGNSGGGEGDSDVEEALLQALQDKTDAYVAAQGELRALEWEIENAVYTAKQNAINGTATLTAQGRTFTGAADTDDTRDTESVAMMTKVEDEVKNTWLAVNEEKEVENTCLAVGEEEDVEDTCLTVGAGEAEIVPEAIDASESVLVDETAVDPVSAFAEGGSGFDLDIEIEDVTGQLPSSQESGNDEESNFGAEIGDGSDYTLNSDMGSTSGSAENDGDMIIDDPVNQTEPQTPKAAELAQIEQTVRANYSQKLAAAQKKVSDAQAGKETAEAALVKYQQAQLAANDSLNTQTAQQLASDVQTAQQAYEDAALAANEAAVVSGRAVAIANIADPSNSSDRMNEISYEQMELTLEKLEGLKKTKGKVCAEADGLITKINIMTGEKTLDTTALLMADLSKGYRFTADITKEQQKYIGTGDLVRLTSGDGKQKLEDLPVESVSADENSEEIYHVTVQVPEDSFEIGRNVNLDFVRKSETYPVTVPLSALHLDEKQQPYVLVVEEYNSIMGTEQRARKVSVTVLEQNESYAALAEGAIGSETEIIVQSDKAVDNGSRVRVG